MGKPQLKLFDRENLMLDFKAASTEFIGIIVFLLMGLGGIQAAATSNAAAAQAADANSNGGASINEVASIEQLQYVATSMGLALLTAACPPSLPGSQNST
jgi:aquaporin related protein